MKKTEVKKLAAQYPKFVEWSEEDKCFIGRCPLLFQGAIHGSNEPDLYREICETAEEWVAIIHADGALLPTPRPLADYSGKFMVRIDPLLHQRLALKAVSEGESLNTFIAKKLAKA